MASQRKIIRAAIVSALKNAAIVGQSVYPNRWLPTWETELPAIFVYTASEDEEVFNLAPREMRRTAQVVTEIVALADAGLDDALDDFSDLIENAMVADPQFAGTADDAILKSVELELFSNGDALMGSLKLTWDVRWYKQMPGDLSGSLPQLVKADVKIDISPQDGIVEGEDSITLPPFVNTQSLSLDGTKHISVPSGAGIRVASPPFALGIAATWSAWIKPSNLSQARTLFACRDAGSPNVGFEVGIGLATLGKLGLFTGSTTGPAVSEDAGAAISTGVWAHVALTFDGVNVRFYKNGILSSTIARTEAIGKAAAPLFLGADTSQPSTRRFIGKVNNFSIWNLAMSAGQISELYSTTRPTDLRTHSAFAAGKGVGWWQLMGNQDGVYQVQDLFGNNHGAAINVVSADLAADVP